MFANTLAVFDKITKDLKAVVKYVDIILQFVLLALCAYNIYNNIGNNVRFIIYVMMGVISLFWLIFSLIYHFSKNKSHKEKTVKQNTGFILKCIKLFYRLFLLAYSLIEIIYFGTTPISIILTTLSILSFIVQLLTTIVLRAVNNYIGLLQVAFEQDTKVFKDIANTGTNIIEGIKNPIYGISKLFSKKEVKPLDKAKENKLKTVEELRMIREADKKAKREEKKEEFKQYKKSVIQNFKEKFSKKNKNKNLPITEQAEEVSTTESNKD